MFTYFASTEEAASGGLLGALGIDLRLFVTQLVAFLVLLFVLKKWVFPPIIGAIDKRQEAVEAAAEEAAEARRALERAEEKAEAVLVEARKEAEAVLARSHEEATRAVAESESKAKERAEQIVADARQQLDTDVKKARATLKKDAVELVAAATERIIDAKVDSAKDKALIEQSLEKAGA